MPSIINATTTTGVAVTGDNSGSLQLATNNGTTAVTIDASQNVKIGATGTNGVLQLARTSDGATITNFKTDGTSGIIDSAVSTTFQINTVEAMRINSSRQVGIGTTSPTNPLHIVNSSANVNLLNLVGTNTYTSTSLAGEGPFRFQNTNTTNGNMSSFSNYDGNGNLNAQVNFVNINHSGVGSIAFTVRNGGSFPEAMRIDDEGALLINRTTQANSERFAITGNSGSQCMSLTSPITGAYDMCNMINGNGQVGVIQTNGSATSYNTSSDYRLKENIAPMTGALAKVAQLKPVTYTWKVDGKDSQGFIAHELQEVVPDCVTGEKDGIEDIGTIADAKGNVIKTNVKNPDVLNKGLTWTKTGSEPKYQGIDTSFLVATLTAAIQELNAKVEAQAVRIAELEGAR